MKTRASLCAVFAAAILLGCATPSITQVAPGILECPRAQCQLHINIDSNGNVSADHMQVNLKVPNTIITWTLHNRPGFPTYEFRTGSPTESIVFKDPNAAAASQGLASSARSIERTRLTMLPPW